MLLLLFHDANWNCAACRRHNFEEIEAMNADRMRASPCKSSYKYLSITCIAIQCALSYIATEFYKSSKEVLLASSSGSMQLGASFHFCSLSQSYLLICFALLLWHEGAEWWLRRRAGRLEHAVEKLRQIKKRTEENAGKGNKGNSNENSKNSKNNQLNDREDPSDDPNDDSTLLVHSLALHSQEILGLITSLGLSSDLTARLLQITTMDSLPSSSHISSLLRSLYLDKDYLSRGQRRLIWTSNVFFVVIYGLGMFYAGLERWNIRTSVDFIIVTLTSIGFGNTSPKTDLGKFLLFIFFPLGFTVVGYTIAVWWKGKLTNQLIRITQINILFSQTQSHFFFLSFLFRSSVVILLFM